jgi:hypothetical protein
MRDKYKHDITGQFLFEEWFRDIQYPIAPRFVLMYTFSSGYILEDRIMKCDGVPYEKCHINAPTLEELVDKFEKEWRV